MEQETINKIVQISLLMNEISAPRIDRLQERHPIIHDWPVFELLFFQRSAPGVPFKLTEEKFDALVAVFQFVNTEKTLPDERFDRVFDAVVQKIKNKGGPKCEDRQIQDICYEAQIALRLECVMPGWAEIELEDENRPDLVFRTGMSEIAIECKNIRMHRDSVRDLVRSVTSAIKGAVLQHKPRTEQFGDLLIFVDLPVGVLSYPQADYYKLIVNVWQQLELEGFNSVDETQVIFTALSQQKMAEYLRLGPGQATGLTILRPHTVERTEIWVNPARLSFLSMFFREPGDNPNVENWSKVATRIVNPAQYRLP